MILWPLRFPENLDLDGRISFESGDPGELLLFMLLLRLPVFSQLPLDLVDTRLSSLWLGFVLLLLIDAGSLWLDTVPLTLVDPEDGCFPGKFLKKEMP